MSDVSEFSDTSGNSEFGVTTGDLSDGNASEFKCRKCPGKRFTQAEMGPHRKFHRREKERDGQRRLVTIPPPEPSELTLFEPVQVRGQQGRKRPADQLRAPIKRIARKRYNQALVDSWYEDVTGG